MIGDIPLLADVSKTEMVSPQMAKDVLGILPGLIALHMAEAADETRIYTCFIGIFEKSGVNLSCFDPKFLGLYLHIRERTYQRFQTDFIGEYLAQKCYNAFLYSLFPAPVL